jgi:CheY-like chemotaxis protein/signal transduction histidine kinase
VSDPSTSEARQLRSRLIVAIATPLLLLLGLGALLGVQIRTLNTTAEWVDHTDSVIATGYEALKGILDQETALRGYLLSDDPSFLDAYRQAVPQRTLQDLEQLVLDNPPQRQRVQELRALYEEWLGMARGAVEGGDVKEARTRPVLLARKQLMDRIRQLARQMLDVERGLRLTRTQSLTSTRNVTAVGSLLLLVTCALTIAFVVRRQLAGVAETFVASLQAERETRNVLTDENWVREQQVALARAVPGDVSIAETCARSLNVLAAAVRADVAAVYLLEGKQLRRVASYAHNAGTGTGPLQFELGEGLLGQAALDQRVLHLTDVPADYLVVRSGTGQRDASELLLLPCSIEGRVFAIVELGFLAKLEPRARAFCERASEILANAIRAAEYRSNLREYLEETQRQAEELAAQQEELRVANEELAEQSNALREAQVRSEEQQAELEQTNTSLGRQASLLEHQNDHLRRAQDELSLKATEVARANQYKSEFLANMSHELRTPLNSTLILAKLLADNKEQNLNPEQVRFAETIYGAGNDLLILINDVLDLSRIEAGKMEVHPSTVSLARALEAVQRTFEPVARQKSVGFELQVDQNGMIETDLQRFGQIVRNLLSNAFKFTESGQVSLHASTDADGITLVVRDTGIGIAEENLETIFEAFRQADGTTHRKFGGTGLGLSISRDLAHLLGGELRVESRLGSGSAFTLTLPRRLPASGSEVSPPPLPVLAEAKEIEEPAPSVRRSEQPPPMRSGVADDRAKLAAGKRVLLIVEDDAAFANVLIDLGREHDFQVLAAESADEAMRLAQKYPPSAVILDITLPDHSGLSVLDRLKRNPATRHIPVHVISATDQAQTALSMGAVGYALKPVQRAQLVQAVQGLKDTFSREQRVVLVVEDDAVQRASVARLLAGPGVEIVPVDSVEAALHELKSRTFDCIVTDLSFPSASGYDLLETLAQDQGYAFPPVIVYTGRSLTAEEEQRLRRYSSSIIVKGARSPERLLDEVTLFLHQVEASLPADHRRMLREARDREALFEGRTILLAEDDVRNVFALASVLEPKGAKVEIARNGREAIERLEQLPDVALVLMDVMMPEMDGLTAMREIRKRREWQKLPIIALTAKAMPDDQEKCLNAGASDYVSKPFDAEMLLSLMRVWLSR